MKRFFSFFKGYCCQTVLAPLFKLLEALNELIVPLIVAKIIDNGIAYNQTGYVVKMCLVLVGLGAMGLLSATVAQYFSAVGATGYAKNMRSSLMQKIQTFSFSELDKRGANELINTLNEDVTTIQNGINMGLRLLLRSPLVAFGAVIFALFVDVKASLVFIAMLAVLVPLVFLIMFKGVKKFSVSRRSADKVMLNVRENLNGVREVKAFSLQNEQVACFNASNEKHNDESIKSANFVSFLNPLTFAIVNVSIIILIYSGAIRVYHGALTQGLVVALYNYMTQILVELVKMANLTVNFSKMIASYQRVVGVLSCESYSEVKFSLSDEKLPYIFFNDLSFSYSDGKDVLKNVTLKIEKGEKTGIIGSTGSGKSTLASLIYKAYSVNDGKLFLAGKDINSYSDEEVRSMVSVVPQKAVLFKGTVKSNLSWGYEKATESDMIKALKDAEAYDFIMEKGGLDTTVEEGGRNFSGGQRQRLTIARALIKHSPIIIFDDSFSALDFATEASIIKNLESYGQTAIIISQRISSFKGADKIVVMEKGEIEAVGDMPTLEKISPTFKEITYTKGGEQ